MNVNTHFGTFGKYAKTQHPDGSITLSDQEKGQHIEIALGKTPLTTAEIEKLFADKYPAE